MKILFDNLESLIDAPNGIEKARELILLLAVQGKLTGQEPTDEPASELLKKIKQEKERLIAEGEIKRPKNSFTITDSDKSFNLPRNWEWEKIGNIITVIRGASPRPKGDSRYFSKERTKYHWIKISDIRKYSKDNVLNDTDEFLTEAGRDRSIELPKGTLVLTNSATIGVPVVLGFDGGCIHDGYLAFPYFPHQYLSQPYFLILFRTLKEYATKQARGMAQLNLNTDIVRNFPFGLPPLTEQKRIVEKVNSLMALLDELEEKRERRNKKRIKLNNASLEKLLTSKDDKELNTNWKRIEKNFSTLYSVAENVEKLKQSILQLAVQGKLVKQDPKDEPALELFKKIKKEKENLVAEGKIKKQNELPPIKDEEKPFELPKGWDWVRLGQIGLINPRNDIPDDFNVSFIPMALISEKFGVMAKSETRTWGEIKKGFTHFANDDVGLAKITPCFENGKAAVFTNLSNGFGAGTTELHIFRRIVNDISPDFIYALIKTPFFVDGGKSQMTGTAGQQRVSKDYFQNYLFALPPAQEQKRIVEKVNELMSLCNALEEELTKKEATAEKLVGAVVNAVTNKTNKLKDDKEIVIKDILNTHKKALEKLS